MANLWLSDRIPSYSVRFIIVDNPRIHHAFTPISCVPHTTFVESLDVLVADPVLDKVVGGPLFGKADEPARDASDTVEDPLLSTDIAAIPDGAGDK